MEGNEAFPSVATRFVSIGGWKVKNGVTMSIDGVEVLLAVIVYGIFLAVSWRDILVGDKNKIPADQKKKNPLDRGSF